VPDAAPGAAAIECRALDVDVPGRSLVQDLAIAVPRGQMLAVLGRNGAGKSTLLHTLSGLRPPAGGEVRVHDRLLADWPRRALALELALLQQSVEDPFPALCLDAVLVGRHPHIDFWAWESPVDRAVARHALAEVGLQGFESREVATLSGGERRRLAIATLLAQDTSICLLDEPIDQLDPQHQLHVLELFRGLADAGRTVVVSLHEVGMAARYADSALLLFGDGRWRHGPCDQVLDAESVGELYGVRVRELRWDGGRTFVAG
jgi:iron complex transport system ATP-binding protein